MTTTTYFGISRHSFIATVQCIALGSCAMVMSSYIAGKPAPPVLLNYAPAVSAEAFPPTNQVLNMPIDTAVAVFFPLVFFFGAAAAVVWGRATAQAASRSFKVTSGEASYRLRQHGIGWGDMAFSAAAFVVASSLLMTGLTLAGYVPMEA